MKQARKCKLICLVVSLILSGCTGAPDLPTPDKIGEKERLRVISGQSFGTTLPPQLLALYPIREYYTIDSRETKHAKNKTY